jgi:low temperature requirement protein LtrA
MHLALYGLAGRESRDLLVAVLRLAPWTLLGATLILVAGFTDGARTWLWLGALTCTYVGAGLSGSAGWRVFPSHLAERYGLVLIIALGEAFVAIGISVTRIGLGEVAAAVLGLLVATSFWLAYFDYFSIRGERMLTDLRGEDRVALARDVYAYAHLPMITAIVLFAFAMKTVVGHIGEHLDYVAAFALCGGSALYLLTYSAVRSRVERRVALSRGRFAAAVLLLLVLPLATSGPGTSGAGARHCRLARVARVRARVVARGPRGVALDARFVLSARRPKRREFRVMPVLHVRGEWIREPIRSTGLPSVPSA